jgi:phosphoadenosine phosphosulfate reductase
LGLGFGIKDKNRLISLTRNSWPAPVPEVVLYSLYKFAEACGGFYQLSLTRLLDHDIDSDGVSPTRIFGIDRERMIAILKGLAANHPEYISVAFTHDLDNINLREDKTSKDVVKLI